MKRIMITGALGQIGTELVVKCREIYGTNNVLATDIREPDMDSPVQCGPFELLDVTDKDRMFEVARDFNAYGCITFLLQLRKNHCLLGI